MNLMMISIVEATIADAPEILRIQKAAFEGQARIYNNFMLPPLVQTLKSLEDEFEKKVFLIAVFGGRIKGSVRFAVNGIVEPKFRNQGVGTVLMKRVEELADKKATFKLFTGERSSRNIHLYEKLGYEIYARSETLPGVGLLHMKKPKS